MVSRVTVYGGGKPTLGVVGTCVGLGKHIDWIIRRTGSDAPVLKPGHLFGVNFDSFIGSRCASKWNLNVYSCEDGWYKFFYSGKNKFGFVSWLLNKNFGHGKSENLEKLRLDGFD